MKILIMDEVMPQLNRSVAVHRWELIRNLAKIGHDVYVIANKDIEIKGVHTTLLKAKEGVIGKLSSRIRYVWMLFKLAMRYHFDILYTRNGLTGAIGHLLKMITGSKLVYELNGILSDEWKLWKKQNKSNVFEKIEMALSIRAEMLALKKADAIIAVTQGIKNYLVNCGINESKITVIGNGANTDLFKPVDDLIALQRLRRQYNIEEDDNVVTFVGGLSPWQGVEHLINAAPLILEKVPKTKFLIVGDGIMRNKLEDMVKELHLEDKFMFTGRVPYEDVQKYINMSDVCVHLPFGERNSKIGASSLKLFEYMACGKPIVTSNVGGIQKEIECANAGFLVSCNLQEIASSIIKLLVDENLRKNLGRNGHQLAIGKYSWKIIAKRIAKVCENALRW